MRLNLGCGRNKLAGWINVDKAPASNPDQLVDLERFPWPWHDNSVDEVMLSHVLEHLGAKVDDYLGIIKELYRVCRHGATITVVVPDPRHDNYISDPTHVRPVTPESLLLFSQSANREWGERGLANTPLGLYLGVDFATKSVTVLLSEPWRTQLRDGKISKDAVIEAIRNYNNVVEQNTIVLKVLKPQERSSKA